MCGLNSGRLPNHSGFSISDRVQIFENIINVAYYFANQTMVTDLHFGFMEARGKVVDKSELPMRERERESN